MAINNNGTYTFVGPMANAWFSRMFTQSVTYTKVFRQEKVKHSVVLPSFDVTNPFDDFSCDDPAGNEDVEFNPVVLTVSPITIFKKICADDLFGTDLSQWLKPGSANDTIIGTPLEEQIMMVLEKASAEQLEQLLWRGDTTLGAGSPLRFINGFLKQMTTASVPTVSGAVPITSANFVTEMNRMKDAILTAFPDNAYDEDFIWIVPNHIRGLLYGQSGATNTGNGHMTDWSQVPLQWDGIKIDAVPGISPSNMVAGRWLSLAVGTDLTDDMARVGVLDMYAQDLTPVTKMRADFKLGTAIRSAPDQLLWYKP